MSHHGYPLLEDSDACFTFGQLFTGSVEFAIFLRELIAHNGLRSDCIPAIDGEKTARIFDITK